MCHVPTYCYILQFHSIVKLEQLYEQKAVTNRKFGNRIAKQRAGMISKTTSTIFA